MEKFKMYVVRVQIPSPPFFFEEKFEFESLEESQKFIEEAKKMDVKIIGDYQVSPMSADSALRVCKAIILMENLEG
jgi:guanylate kinase